MGTVRPASLFVGRGQVGQLHRVQIRCPTKQRQSSACVTAKGMVNCKRSESVRSVLLAYLESGLYINIIKSIVIVCFFVLYISEELTLALVTRQ
jgi:hypothetical protein